jgi:hypothetical protein
MERKTLKILLNPPLSRGTRSKSKCFEKQKQQWDKFKTVKKDGAEDGIRTRDFLLGKEAFYH